MRRTHEHGDGDAHHGHGDEHGHGHSTHEHGDGTHDHDHSRAHGWRHGLGRSHSHDHAESVDEALLVSRTGTRALAISVAGLLGTAAIQAGVSVASGSVGLLADTIHNAADACTALPIGLALVVARRPPTKRYTYGYGRAEDLAGLAVVIVVALSAVVAGWEAVDRLVRPHTVTDLGWVAAAGIVGFLGNELVARYRLRVGHRIGSAALVADGHHARIDGFTSLAVVAGALGVSLGWRAADPVVGLVITVVILGILRDATRNIWRRLMDAVDPALVDQVRQAASGVPGVEAVGAVRVRWLGHELRAELDVTVDRNLHVFEAHAVAESVRHELLHRVQRLVDATIHTDPGPHDDPGPHSLTAHHYQAKGPQTPRILGSSGNGA